MASRGRSLLHFHCWTLNRTYFLLYLWQLAGKIFNKNYFWKYFSFFACLYIYSFTLIKLWEETVVLKNELNEQRYDHFLLHSVHHWGIFKYLNQWNITQITEEHNVNTIFWGSDTIKTCHKRLIQPWKWIINSILWASGKYSLLGHIISITFVDLAFVLLYQFKNLQHQYHSVKR